MDLCILCHQLFVASVAQIVSKSLKSSPQQPARVIVICTEDLTSVHLPLLCLPAPKGQYRGRVQPQLCTVHQRDGFPQLHGSDVVSAQGSDTLEQQVVIVKGLGVDLLVPLLNPLGFVVE